MSIINELLNEISDNNKKKTRYTNILNNNVESRRPNLEFSVSLLSINIILLLSAAVIYLVFYTNFNFHHFFAKKNKPTTIPLVKKSPHSVPAPLEEKIVAENVLKIEKDPEDELYELAEKNYSKHNLASTEELLTKIIINNSNNKDANNLLVKALFAENNPSRALHVINNIEKKSDLNAALYKAKIQLLIQSNKIADAITEIENFSEKFIPDLELNYFAANAYLQNNEFEKANQRYKRLTEIDPSNGGSWMGYAITLEELGATNLAVNAYKRAINSHNINNDVEIFARERVNTLIG